jgi:hypothetical protein
MSRARWTLMAIVVVTAASCGETAATTTMAAPATAATTTAVTTTAATTTAVAGPFADFSIADIAVAGTSLRVAVADTGALRARGLMDVTDLGELDGMLFVFPADTAGGFWMKNTLIPLDIWFFDAAGAFVDAFAMEPCEVDPCPVYEPSAAYRCAVETPAGSQAEPGPDAMLEIVGS